MPTYLFYDKKTKIEWEEFMGIAEHENFLETNPHVEQLVNGFPGHLSGVPLKPDNGFRDVLREIKKRNSRGFSQSTVETY